MFGFRNLSLRNKRRNETLQPACRGLLASALVAMFIAPSVLAQVDQQCNLVTEGERALERMLLASADVRFTGTVLYERAGSRQFLTVARSEAPGMGELRRMNAQANPRAEIWPAPIRSNERVCDVAAVYVPSIESGRVVAGRSTQRLTLRPRDTLRLAHVIDLDSESGLALAMATVGPDGQMLERYEYAAIDYQERAADDNGVEAAVQVDSVYARGRAVIPGYFVMSEDPDRGIFVVSDGLATASVFVEPLPAGAPAGEGAVIEGATLTYTRGVPSSNGGLLISVLGEVPVVTARLLADAVRATRGES